MNRMFHGSFKKKFKMLDFVYQNTLAELMKRPCLILFGHLKTLAGTLIAILLGFTEMLNRLFIVSITPSLDFSFFSRSS